MWGPSPQVVEVIQVQPDPEEPVQCLSTTREMVSALLDMLRPGVVNYGGVVDVTSVQNGVCEIRWVEGGCTNGKWKGFRRRQPSPAHTQVQGPCSDRHWNPGGGQGSLPGHP